MRVKCPSCKISLRPIAREYYAKTGMGLLPVGWVCNKCGGQILVGDHGSEIARYVWGHVSLSDTYSWADALKRTLFIRDKNS